MPSTFQENEELLNQVKDGQRLVTVMSEDLLAVTQRMLQELDELRTMVDGIQGNQSETGLPVPPSSTAQPDILHPSLEPYRDIYRRAAEGQSVIAIAKEMGMGKGEVELVLALGQHLPNKRHKS